MEPSTTLVVQTGVPTGNGEPSPMPLDYEDEFLHYLWRDYLYPKQYEWVLIAAYVAVFLVALVGNTLGRSSCCCGIPQGTGRASLLFPSPQPLSLCTGSVGEGLADEPELRRAWLGPWLHFIPMPSLSLPGRVAEPPHEDRHQLLHCQPVPGRRAGDSHLPACQPPSGHH